MVDTVDSKSTGEIRAGSSPVLGTICKFTKKMMPRASFYIAVIFARFLRINLQIANMTKVKGIKIVTATTTK